MSSEKHASSVMKVNINIKLGIMKNLLGNHSFNNIYIEVTASNIHIEVI